MLASLYHYSETEKKHLTCTYILNRNCMGMSWPIYDYPDFNYQLTSIDHYCLVLIKK